MSRLTPEQMQDQLDHIKQLWESGQFATRKDLGDYLGMDKRRISEKLKTLGFPAAGIGNPTGNNQYVIRMGDTDSQEPTDAPQVYSTYENPRAKVKRLKKPSEGKVNRFIITCAYNNMDVNNTAMDNLEALAKHLNAPIIVTTCSYDQSNSAYASVKRGQEIEKQDMMWHPRFEPYICDDIVYFTDTLMLAGNYNISPTAKNPLTGINVGGKASVIVPTNKHAFQVMPSASSHEGTKSIMGTATMCKHSLIQRKSGINAEHFWTLGALLVEVDDQGTWFIRQLECGSLSQEIYHDDIVVRDGIVSENKGGVEAIQPGDLHVNHLEEDMRSLLYDMITKLKPSKVFAHDLIDSESINHHHKGNDLKSFEKHLKGSVDYQDEIEKALGLLEGWVELCDEVVVVDSNHDRQILNFINNHCTDPENMLFHAELRFRVLQQMHFCGMRSEDVNIYDIIYHSIMPHDVSGFTTRIKFLMLGDSYIIGQEYDGEGIEMALHGCKGPNGSRGSPASFKRLSRKVCTGHTHTPYIGDGLYTAGVSASLDHGYNRGPSSWLQAHTIIYPNNTRTLVLCYGKNGELKWRA